MKAPKPTGIAVAINSTLRETDKGEESFVTVYCKGVLVSGEIMSISSYHAAMEIETYETGEEEDILPPEEENAYRREAEISRRRKAHFAHNKDEIYQTFVIRNALVIVGGHFHWTPAWLGNVASVDGFEQRLLPQHPDSEQSKQKEQSAED